MAMAGKRTVTQEPLGSVDRSEVREDSLPAIHLTTRHTTPPSHIRPRSLCMIYWETLLWCHCWILGTLPEPQASSQAQKSQVQTGRDRD